MNRLFVFFVLLLPLTLAAAPRHFIYLFSYDDGQMTPTENHTWAAVVEARDNGEVEWHGIDWLPISGVINTLAMGPERARNFPLKVAFERARQGQHPISQWGPYQTTDELYQLALKQIALLDSREVWYRVLDSQNRIFKLLDPSSVLTPRAVMCIHAVSDIVQPVDKRGFLLTGATSGDEATLRVAWHLNPWYVRDTNGALAPIEPALVSKMDAALGLGAYSIQHRPLQEKTNLYCDTLEKCRELADTMTLPE